MPDLWYGSCKSQEFSDGLVRKLRGNVVAAAWKKNFLDNPQFVARTGQLYALYCRLRHTINNHSTLFLTFFFPREGKLLIGLSGDRLISWLRWKKEKYSKVAMGFGKYFYPHVTNINVKLKAFRYEIMRKILNWYCTVSGNWATGCWATYDHGSIPAS